MAIRAAPIFAGKRSGNRSKRAGQRSFDEPAFASGVPRDRPRCRPTKRRESPDEPQKNGTVARHTQSAPLPSRLPAHGRETATAHTCDPGHPHVCQHDLDAINTSRTTRTHTAIPYETRAWKRGVIRMELPCILTPWATLWLRLRPCLRLAELSPPLSCASSRRVGGRAWRRGSARRLARA